MHFNVTKRHLLKLLPSFQGETELVAGSPRLPCQRQFPDGLLDFLTGMC